MTKYSILDLVRIRDNGSAKTSLNNARDLARHAEQWGYTRFWMAEHHNMPGIASAATSVAIGHVAEGTETIRVGAGGIMLPNHSPLVIAEQFGTLDALFPGRIDLGLGRAPGTDQLTLRALRRHPGSADSFPQDVLELQALLGPVQPGQRIQAVPGANSHVPLWILGSSTFGAAMAGEFGLPYAFASHFAPDYLYTALETYRSRFKLSEQQETPYCMMGINIIVAPTDEEAEFLASTQRMSVTNLLRGDRGLSKPPIADIDTYWSVDERVQAQRMLAMSVVGSPDTVRTKLEGILAQTRANELMIVSDVYDHALRLRSYEYIAQVMLALNSEKTSHVV
jgi:luciferase family oxidoreductase group 1